MENRIDEATLAPLDGRDFSTFLDSLPSNKEINDWLDRQHISADAKQLLAKVANLAIKVGNTIIAVGRKVLGTIAEIIRRHPGTAFGIVVGAVLSFLIGSIPVIGALLGAFLSPILLAFGIGMGAVSDFSSLSLRTRMDAIQAEYEILRT